MNIIGYNSAMEVLLNAGRSGEEYRIRIANLMGAGLALGMGAAVGGCRRRTVWWGCKGTDTQAKDSKTCPNFNA
jgi:hypothetical protein